MAVVSLQSLYISFIMIKVKRCRQVCGTCSTTLAGSGLSSPPGDVRLHKLHEHTGVRSCGKLCFTSCKACMHVTMHSATIRKPAASHFYIISKMTPGGSICNRTSFFQKTVVKLWLRFKYTRLFLILFGEVVKQWPHLTLMAQLPLTVPQWGFHSTQRQ